MEEMDNQPIEATFFGEGRWLSSFITPHALEVEDLHAQLTDKLVNVEERLAALHQWVASEVRYKPFISGKLWVEGKASVQRDLWMQPSMTRRIQVGNCANKSFLLASLVRQELGPDSVYCVLGNLHNGKTGGHAWVQVNLNGRDYIIESTRPDVRTLVPTTSTDRYEAIHYFNDQRLYAVPGKTVLEPFTKCFSTWLRDYLDWAYIEGRGRK